MAAAALISINQQAACKAAAWRNSSGISGESGNETYRAKTKIGESEKWRCENGENQLNVAA